MKTDRKQYNSTLRPVSLKRQRELQSGAFKPKPRKPLKAKAPNHDDEEPKRYRMRIGKNAIGTFGTRTPDPRTIAVLKDVIRMAMEKEEPRSKINYKSGSARAKLDDELMIVYSRYRRRAAADESERYFCFLCGRMLGWNDEDACLMHFQGRICAPTRFHDQATQPGCFECNAKPNGDRPNFARKLDKEYGPGTADDLTRLSKTMVKYDRQWYRDQILHYTAELNKLLS